MDCPHTLLVEAHAQLSGIINTAAESNDAPLSRLTGFQLSMMLKPVAESIEKSMKLIAN